MLAATVIMTLLCSVPAEVEAKGDTDRLTPEALKGLVNKPELLALTESLTPNHTVAFWMPESEMEAMELELGAGVRLKTRGDGPFLGEQCNPHCGPPFLCGPWELSASLMSRAHGSRQGLASVGTQPSPGDLLLNPCTGALGPLGSTAWIPRCHPIPWFL